MQPDRKVSGSIPSSSLEPPPKGIHMRKLFSSKLTLFALTVAALALAGGTAAALGAHSRTHQPAAPKAKAVSHAARTVAHAVTKAAEVKPSHVTTQSDPASTDEQDNEAVDQNDDQADQPEATNDDQGDQVEQDDQGDSNDDQGDSNDDQGDSGGGDD